MPIALPFVILCLEAASGLLIAMRGVLLLELHPEDKINQTLFFKDSF